MPRKKKEAPSEPKPTRVEIETFREPDSYWLGQLRKDNPSCFNGDIQVHRYRVTVELIEESPEVIGARIQELWNNCDNWHHHDPLRFAAKKIGWELKGDFGNKKKEA